MGYTHYWSHGDIDPQKWAVLMADTRRVILATVVPLAGGDGTGAFTLNSEELTLNGDAATDDDYETFQLTPRATGFDFCKTARRPYDAVVGAILLRAYHLIAGFSLSSDGRIDGEDWEEARHLYREAFYPESVPTVTNA
jgi:hypothetical protein